MGALSTDVRLPGANCHRPALISSPESGVFDVASVCFSLRRGLVISSGARDAFDEAIAMTDDTNTCSLSVGPDDRPAGGDAGQWSGVLDGARRRR